MAFLTNIYPPIVPDYVPAFVYTERCKIKYNISPYMKESDFRNAQITVVDANTNQSVLDSSKYPAGIKNSQIYKNQEQDQNINPYFIWIVPSDLKRGAFYPNKIYKVQIRFISSELSSVASSAQWNYNNRKYFSQWSRPCLIKPIVQPVLRLTNFENFNNNQIRVFYVPYLEVSGTLYFDENLNQNSEYLNHYNIKIYEQSNLTQPVYETEQIYTELNVPNNINHLIQYNLQDAKTYVMRINYTTNNLFTKTQQQKFVIYNNGYAALDATIVATMDEDRGHVKVRIKSDNGKYFMGNVMIRRTSSKSNFTIWQDVHCKTIVMAGGIDYIWEDKTVESGIFYHYCAQRINSLGQRGVIIKTRVPVMGMLQDMFLVNSEGQLRIRFNPTLSGFKYNVTESQQIGIGAKFPQVKRNGNNFYRSFSIGGLISSFMDTSEWYTPRTHNLSGEAFSYHNENTHENVLIENQIGDFATKDTIYGEHKQLYQEWNVNHNTDEYQDYIYERQFRNKVYDFLYKHNAKLFRSTTEGNVLVKLTDLNFQPVESLGRRLYSFTATAIEIDEPTEANFRKYNILDFEDDDWANPSIKTNINMLGQINGYFAPRGYGSSQFLTNQNLFGQVIAKRIHNKQIRTMTVEDLEEYDTNKSQLSDYTYVVNYLNYLKIEFTSQPYLVWNYNGELVKVDQAAGVSKKYYDLYKQSTNKNAVLGYIAIINGKEILVRATPERRLVNTYQRSEEMNQTSDFIVKKTANRNIFVGRLEFKEPNTRINDIKIKYPSVATIDYVANVDIKENLDNLIAESVTETKVGQITDVFDVDEQVIRKIYSKYYKENYDEYGNRQSYEKVKAIISVEVQALPGTVMYVKDPYDEEKYDMHVLADGFLRLQDDQLVYKGLQGLKFGGIFLTKKLNDSPYIRQTEFVYMGHVDYKPDRYAAQPNGLYQIGSDLQNMQICYNSQWYKLQGLNANDIDSIYSCIIPCPVKAIVDYIFIKEEGKYVNNI